MKITKKELEEMINIIRNSPSEGGRRVRINELSKKFGISPQTIYYHINKTLPDKIVSDSTRHKQSLKRRKKAIELFKKGYSTEQIAKELNITEKTARRYLHGIINKRGRKRKLDKDSITAIINMAKVGYTQEEIIKHFNVSKFTLRRTLKEYLQKYSLKDLKLLTVNSRGKGNMKYAIIELYKQGLSNVEITSKLGVNLFIVNKAIKNYKEELKKQESNKIKEKTQ